MDLARYPGRPAQHGSAVQPSGDLALVRLERTPSARQRTDEVIGRIAAQQHGLVSRTQLIRAGVPQHVIAHRVTAKLLRPVHSGVYRVGPLVPPRAREMAAVLACDGAVVSHRSAAALRSLLPPQKPNEPVDVTLPPGQHRGRRPGIRTHRSILDPSDITVVQGIPVTSPARTLIDLAGVASSRQLERALALAEREDDTVRKQLLALLRRATTRKGTRTLRAMLRAPAALTRSEAEDRLLDLLRSGGLPRPQTNVIVHGHEVDCYWRHAGLIVEVDGFAYHSSKHAFVRDRQRDTELAAAGIQVVRVTWRQIEKEPRKTLVHLAQALAYASRESRISGAASGSRRRR